MNKHFQDIVQHTPSLWREIIAANDSTDWTPDLFLHVLKHIKQNKKFIIGHINTNVSSYLLDNYFISSVETHRPEYLHHLDISALGVSTLSFLLYTPNIKTLVISECKNIIACDLNILKTLKKLTWLECAFLKVDSAKLVRQFRYFKLTHLDVAGLPFTPQEIDFTLDLFNPGFEHFSFSTADLGHDEVDDLRSQYNTDIVWV